MYLRFFIVYILSLSITACSSSKKIAKTTAPSTAIADSVRVHISYLADEKLEGRRTGTAGEQKAAAYIKERFESIGLLPKGTIGYTQPFEVNEGRMIAAGTRFVINGDSLLAGKEFFPFPYSANTTLAAQPSPGLQEVDMPWFIDVKEILDENKNNPHFDLPDYIRNNSKKAKDKGATAIILYNSAATDDKLAFDAKDRTEAVNIPVLYVSKEVAAKYFKDPSAVLNIQLTTAVTNKIRKGLNVVGYIDNGAPNTVILGAHFDHLGYGEDGNSRHTNHEAVIHNGADDNASGTAALIELARKIKVSDAKANNYLVIAFSGEELGLYGSKYFVDNPTIDFKMANYMINMDMVGRLNDSTKVLTIGGYGTSPTWADVINNTDYFKLPYATNEPQQFVIKTDSSGTGPSDHTSFYRKDIPVLFYFTGLHTDYHKPSDDADKINYVGEQSIINHILMVINYLDSKPKLSFLKTRETQTTTSARFSVSMGIMPDYTYAGAGVRADGVSEGKPAQKGGLKAGDIILQIGDYNVSSLESYMQTLGKFKKGDKTKVKFKRGNEVLEAVVEF
jgi:aminopeptidase YwaD